MVGDFEALTDEELQAKDSEIKDRLEEGETLTTSWRECLRDLGP